jgi:septal ring-binding cell division protein DamX
MVAGGLFIWPALHRPAPSEPSGGTPPVVEPAPLSEAIQGLPVERVPQGSIAAAIPMPEGQEKETPQDLAAQKRSGGVAPSGSTTAPMSSAGTQRELKTKPPRSTAKGKSLPQGPYSIQIKSFREEAKARAFLHDLKTRHTGTHLQKATVAGQGNWYRVLIGHYRTRDQALADLKKKGIAESYPGSFVQKTGKGD